MSRQITPDYTVNCMHFCSKCLVKNCLYKLVVQNQKFRVHLFAHYTSKISHFPIKCPVILCPDILLPSISKKQHFFGENVHYKNVYHIFPPDDTTKILQFKVKCPVLRCSEQLPDYITELHRFLGKCPRVFCSQHLLQIIPVNYLILCKNVHDFFVYTISSDYT